MHCAKRRRTAPNAAKLATVANRLAPVSNQDSVHPIAPNRLNAAPGASNFTFVSRPNAVAGPSNPGNRATGAVNGPEQAARPIVNPTGVVSLPAVPAVPAAIANAARQGGPDPEFDEFEQFSLSRKRKRSSQPAPHHIGSRTPNSRAILRHGKDRYGIFIHTENAYPDPREHVVTARMAHDYAIQLVPDVAAIATGIHWSPAKVRLYGDIGWVKRGLIKTTAASLVPSFFRLHLPPALADTLPRGANPTNTAQYVRSRVLYLLHEGQWLRGSHAGVCHSSPRI